MSIWLILWLILCFFKMSLFISSLSGWYFLNENACKSVCFVIKENSKKENNNWITGSQNQGIVKNNHEKDGYKIKKCHRLHRGSWKVKAAERTRNSSAVDWKKPFLIKASTQLTICGTIYREQNASKPRPTSLPSWIIRLDTSGKMFSFFKTWIQQFAFLYTSV